MYLMETIDEDGFLDALHYEVSPGSFNCNPLEEKIEVFREAYLSLRAEINTACEKFGIKTFEGVCHCCRSPVWKLYYENKGKQFYRIDSTSYPLKKFNDVYIVGLDMGDSDSDEH